MIERSVLVIALLLFGFVAYGLLRRYHIRKASAMSGCDPLLNNLRPGVQAIVYFTTPGCIPCVTQQQPALVRLQTELGERVQIVKVDATQQADVADRWGVFSAPTTFIVDEARQVRNVNHGVADVKTLRRQLDSVRVTVESRRVPSQAG